MVQILQGNEWFLYEDDFSSRTGNAYIGTKTLAIDPQNSNHVYVGSRTGLYEFMSGKMMLTITR